MQHKNPLSHTGIVVMISCQTTNYQFFQPLKASPGQCPGVLLSPVFTSTGLSLIVKVYSLNMKDLSVYVRILLLVYNSQIIYKLKYPLL